MVYALSATKKKRGKRRGSDSTLFTTTSSNRLLQLNTFVPPHMMDLTQQDTGRWRPTQQQLQIMREIYHANEGHAVTREQAAHIATQLQQYGKVGAYNVFCWFRNHRARAGRHLARTTFVELHNIAIFSHNQPSFWNTHNMMIPLLHSRDDHPYQSLEDYAEEGSTSGYWPGETLPLFPTHPGDIIKSHPSSRSS